MEHCNWKVEVDGEPRDCGHRLDRHGQQPGMGCGGEQGGPPCPCPRSREEVLLGALDEASWEIRELRREVQRLEKHNMADQLVLWSQLLQDSTRQVLDQLEARKFWPRLNTRFKHWWRRRT